MSSLSLLGLNTNQSFVWKAWAPLESLAASWRPFPENKTHSKYRASKRMTTPSQRFILGLPMPSSALISISPIRLRTHAQRATWYSGGQTFCIRKKVSTILKRDDRGLYITVQIRYPKIWTKHQNRHPQTENRINEL